MTTCPKCGKPADYWDVCCGTPVSTFPVMEPIKTEREKRLESLLKSARVYVGAFECEFTLHNLPAHAKACRDLQGEIAQALNQPDGEKKD